MPLQAPRSRFAAFRSAHGAAIGFKWACGLPPRVSVIDRWHDDHPEACAQCRGRAFVPSRDPGLRVYRPGSPGLLVTESALADRLLVP